MFSTFFSTESYDDSKDLSFIRVTEVRKYSFLCIDSLITTVPLIDLLAPIALFIVAIRLCHGQALLDSRLLLMLPMIFPLITTTSSICPLLVN